MEIITKVSDITIPHVSIYRNGRIRFSAGATALLNLQADDAVSFCRDENEEWFLKRFSGNVVLRQEHHRKGMMAYHRRFTQAFLAEMGDGVTAVTCRIATRPNDEGLYALLTTTL